MEGHPAYSQGEGLDADPRSVEFQSSWEGDAQRYHFARACPRKESAMLSWVLILNDDPRENAIMKFILFQRGIDAGSALTIDEAEDTMWRGTDPDLLIVCRERFGDGHVYRAITTARVVGIPCAIIPPPF